MCGELPSSLYTYAKSSSVRRRCFSLPGPFRRLGSRGDPCRGDPWDAAGEDGSNGIASEDMVDDLLSMLGRCSRGNGAVALAAVVDVAAPTLTPFSDGTGARLPLTANGATRLGISSAGLVRLLPVPSSGLVALLLVPPSAPSCGLPCPLPPSCELLRLDATRLGAWLGSATLPPPTPPS
jgi:hypothetical protein